MSVIYRAPLFAPPSLPPSSSWVSVASLSSPPPPPGVGRQRRELLKIFSPPRKRYRDAKIVPAKGKGTAVAPSAKFAVVRREWGRAGRRRRRSKEGEEEALLFTSAGKNIHVWLKLATGLVHLLSFASLLGLCVENHLSHHSSDSTKVGISVGFNQLEEVHLQR